MAKALRVVETRDGLLVPNLSGLDRGGAYRLLRRLVVEGKLTPEGNKKYRILHDSHDVEKDRENQFYAEDLDFVHKVTQTDVAAPSRPYFTSGALP